MVSGIDIDGSVLFNPKVDLKGPWMFFAQDGHQTDTDVDWKVVKDSRTGVFRGWEYEGLRTYDL